MSTASLRTLVSRSSSRPCARALASPSAARQASSSAPKLGAAAGHGHAVPAEGDQDHGRSAYGFHSHSRHEHFTFEGEEPYQYEKKGWSEWNTPGWRLTAYIVVGTTLIYPYIPAKPAHVHKANDPSSAGYDSISPTGPDDTRPLLIRLHDYLQPSTEEGNRTYFAKQEGLRIQAEQSQLVSKALVDREEIRRLPGAMLDQYSHRNMVPGSFIEITADDIKTPADDLKDLGLDKPDQVQFKY